MWTYIDGYADSQRVNVLPVAIHWQKDNKNDSISKFSSLTKMKERLNEYFEPSWWEGEYSMIMEMKDGTKYDLYGYQKWLSALQSFLFGHGLDKEYWYRAKEIVISEVMGIASEHIEKEKLK